MGDEEVETSSVDSSSKKFPDEEGNSSDRRRESQGPRSISAGHVLVDGKKSVGGKDQK